MAKTEQSYTFCRICEAVCGLRVSHEDGDISEIAPDADHVVSRGYACIKGLTAHEFRDTPDRITQPLKRVGNDYQPISWQQALAEIGGKLRQLRSDHGADSIGAYLGNPASISYLPPLFTTGFIRALGSSKLYHTGSQDCNNKFVVAERMYGSAQIQPFPDIENIECLIAIGANPAVSKMSFINLPHPIKQLKAIEERGGAVVWLNPRRTESAKQVGQHFFIRPDTDVFFLLGFLNEIIAREAVDVEKVSKYMTGFGHLAELAIPWLPSRVAEVTGIEEGHLKLLVELYLKANGAALYCSTGVNQGTNGTLAFWIQEAINAITGNLDKRGGTLVGKGVVDVTAQTKFDPQIAPERFRIGEVPLVMGSVPAGLLADDILTPGEGQLRALFTVSGNPVLTCANSQRMEQAFDELELMVAIDLVRNESANQADYILPGSHWLERPDVPFMFITSMGTMPEPWFQYTDAVVPLPDEAREECWTLLQLAQAAGRPMFGSRLLHWLLRWFYGSGRDTRGSQRVLGLMLRFARQGGLGKWRKYLHGKRMPANQAGSFLGARVQTPDGKLQLAPKDFIAVAARLDRSFKKAQQAKNSLRLISKRERFSHNSWAHNHPSYIKGERSTNYLYMHPWDADKRALQHGQLVQVASQAGSVQVPLCVTDDMMPGSVALPHGWGHQRAEGLSTASTTTGVNVNILARDGVGSLEPISGMSQLNGIDVEVAAIA